MTKALATKFDPSKYLSALEDYVPEVEEETGSSFAKFNTLKFGYDEDVAESRGWSHKATVISRYQGKEGDQYIYLDKEITDPIFVPFLLREKFQLKEGEEGAKKVVGESTLVRAFDKKLPVMAVELINGEWTMKDFNGYTETTAQEAFDNQYFQGWSKRNILFGSIKLPENTTEEEIEELGAIDGWAPCIADLSSMSIFGAEKNPGDAHAMPAFKNAKEGSLTKVLSELPVIKWKNPATNRMNTIKGINLFTQVSNQHVLKFGCKGKYNTFTSEETPEAIAGLFANKKFWADGGMIDEYNLNIIKKDKSLKSKDERGPVQDPEVLLEEKAKKEKELEEIPEFIPEKTTEEKDEDIEAAFDM